MVVVAVTVVFHLVVVVVVVEAVAAESPEVMAVYHDVDAGGGETDHVAGDRNMTAMMLITTVGVMMMEMMIPKAA